MLIGRIYVLGLILYIGVAQVDAEIAAKQGQMKEMLLKLAKNDQIKPGNKPFLDKFLDKHSQPSIFLKRETSEKGMFDLRIDDRREFKPPIHKAPFTSTGEPWPMPKLYQVVKNKVLHLNLATFKIKVLNKTCDVLRQAIKRYIAIIQNRILEEPYDFVFNYNEKTFDDRQKQENEKYQTVEEMPDLNIIVSTDAARYPHVDMDESYLLTVNAKETKIVAKEVWGALKGLETFSQLLFRKRNTKQIYSKETHIDDAPRFPHRGILMDTSRHFIHKYVIENVLDGMAYNKFNVLHWHIVDDNSFPYQSEVFPKLSEKGAYHPTLVYSLKDIKEIVEYARLRGIRVVPEFDSPGHTFSWLGYPKIKSTCYENGEPVNGPMGPINPAQDETYTFMDQLFDEIFEVFPDAFTHLGGDELHSTCWTTNPSITAYLQEHGGIPQNEANGNSMAYVNKAIGYYFKRLIQTLKKTGIKKKRPTSFIMWEDVLKNTKEVPKDSILQVWMGPSSNVINVNSKGYRALFSTCWYLDTYGKYVLWPQYYECEISPYSTPEEEKGKLLGGEACLWAEFITTETLMTMMWPRASAPAERLWSPRNVRDLASAGRRLQEQRCRMIYRGLPVGHISGPDHCLRYGNAPLGGHDPLNLEQDDAKAPEHFAMRLNTSGETRYSLDDKLTNKITYAIVSNYNQYLPIVNIVVSLAGVYIILMASRCMRKKTRNGN